MTAEDIKNAREISEAGWQLANDCLDILPADDLPMTGMALIHLIAVWLNAISKEMRPLAYMQWLALLHEQLDRHGVMKIYSTTEGDKPEPSEMLH